MNSINSVESTEWTLWIHNKIISLFSFTSILNRRNKLKNTKEMFVFLRKKEKNFIIIQSIYLWRRAA